MCAIIANIGAAWAHNPLVSIAIVLRIHSYQLGKFFTKHVVTIIIVIVLELYIGGGILLQGK